MKSLVIDEALVGPPRLRGAVPRDLQGISRAAGVLARWQAIYIAQIGVDIRQRAADVVVARPMQDVPL